MAKVERLSIFLQRIIDKASQTVLNKALKYDIDEKIFLDEYLWRTKDEQVEIPAYLFRVSNHSDKVHNVLIALKDEKWYMWCGDVYCERELGYEENECYQKKGRTKVCHHMAAVAGVLLNDQREAEEVEKRLNPDFQPKSSVSSSEFDIAYEMKLPMLLYGVTGAGKSHSVLEFVKKLQSENPEVEFFQINMSSGLEDIDLLAKMIPDPESGKWTIRDGELWRAFKTATQKPVIILIEELTRSTKSARNLFLKAMDSVSGKYHLQNFVTGESVEVPVENIWWVATANIGYSDTEEVDPALMRRFLITKFVDYDLEKEKKIVAEILGNEEEAEKIIEKIVKPIRKAYESGQIPYPIDTGTLKVFATLYHRTGDLMKSAQMTFMYRIVDVDSSGKPSEEQIQLLTDIVNAY